MLCAFSGNVSAKVMKCWYLLLGGGMVLSNATNAIASIGDVISSLPYAFLNKLGYIGDSFNRFNASFYYTNNK